MTTPQPKHFTSAEAMGRDPDFIRAWTTNPAIVSILMELQARREARQSQQSPA